MSSNKSFEKAIKFHLEGNYKEALILYKKIIKYQPDFVEVYNNIGTIYYLMGKYVSSLL